MKRRKGREGGEKERVSRKRKGKKRLRLKNEEQREENRH